METYFIVLSCSIILSFIVGGTFTYLIMKLGRRLDALVLDNMAYTLHQRECYIAALTNTPAPHAPRPTVSSVKSFTRSDEEEAMIESHRI